MESLSQIEKKEPERIDAGLVDISDKGIQQLQSVPATLDRVYKGIMKENTDFGRIPGTPKPCLFKPGAELLARWLNLVPRVRIADKVENWDKPFFMYKVETEFYNKEGLFVGNGFGSANTGETRYAWRWVTENAVPANLKKEGLESKVEGNRKLLKIPTPASEIFTLQNTVLKMAQKRSFVGAILEITGASRIFTQDLKDEEDESGAVQAKPVGSGSAKSTGRQVLKYFEVNGKKIEIPVKHPAYDELTESLAVIKSEHPELEYTMKRGRALDGDVIASIKFENISSDAEKKVTELMGSIASAVEGN